MFESWKTETIFCDVVVAGGGGAGLRAAIAVAEKDPSLSVALISKVYPMRSHTVAAEGGAAGVIRDDDSFEDHFNDTVGGGDWLVDQDVAEFFVERAIQEMIDIELRGCPWSRQENGHVATRAFGGMKKERSWYAADKTGFHMLHTLFQDSLRFSSIQRYDEFFTLDLIVEDNVCRGIVAIELKTGIIYHFLAKSVILATGGAGRVFPFTTNGAIKTGDGMAMAYRAGAVLQDMEFIQYHPTGLPGSGILITEGSRGEGGILVNKEGYRYLQDYGMGPPDPWPRKRAMELGPRDRLSQAFWHEERKGKTVDTPEGTAVLLDLRHLGKEKINDRLPMIRDLARSYAGVDPVYEPIPVRPVVHYTMGGIKTNVHTETSIAGLFAAGECASVGLHGANRLGSNSLAELLVFGHVAGDRAVDFAKSSEDLKDRKESLLSAAKSAYQPYLEQLYSGKTNITVPELRRRMHKVMDQSAGIYRDGELLQNACQSMAEIEKDLADIGLRDHSRIFNTELVSAFELRSMISVARAMANSAAKRTESRGAHQRLDFTERDDESFLCHTLCNRKDEDDPEIRYEPVRITKSKPAERVYGK